MTITEADEPVSFHPLVRWGAKAVSYIFHPLFIPVYMGWFFIYVLRMFPQLDAWSQSKLLISFAVNYTLLPLVTLLLAKGLGFVQSIYLKDKKDRIIPYIATGVFYFWIWYVFKNQGAPREVIAFSLAVFLASSLGLLFNSYLKVSMHGIAVGVAATMLVRLGLGSTINLGPYISIALLATGLVCSARLINNDHSPKEVYSGLAIGIFAQLVALFFV
jgi:hypothetical protein